MAGVTQEVAGGVEQERVVPRDRPVVRRLLALLIVVSWGAMVVPAWQSSLREVSPQEFVADIESGRVVGYQAVADVHDEPWRFWGGVGAWSNNVPAADETGRPVDGLVSDLMYTVDSGRTRWVSGLPEGLPEGTDVFGDLQASGARPFTVETYPFNPDWPTYPGFLMTALFLGSLLGLPTRWGTKPFWLFTATLTAGVGVVAYALCELTAKSPQVLRTPRLRWPHGLAIAVIGGLLLPRLLDLLT